MYIQQKYNFEAIPGGKLRLEEPVQMSGQIWPFVGNPSRCPDIYVQIRQVKCPDRCGQVVGRLLRPLSGVLLQDYYAKDAKPKSYMTTYS